jgi:hypothetical protein
MKAATYTWFCICRNYKNGYVWNDLSDNDVIYPSDGVEYVLKGSEIFPGCSSGNDHYLAVIYSYCHLCRELRLGKFFIYLP